MARGVLTTEVLSRYNGGQFEVSNRHEGYTYRGEIEEAKVNGAGDGDIVLKLKWMAKLN